MILREKALEQGGLPCPVASHETDFFATQNFGGEGVEDFQVAVELGEVLELQHMLATRAKLVEADVGAGDVGAGGFAGARPPCGGW